MALQNKYNGICGCGIKVEAGAGFIQGPPWVTFCPSCHAKYTAAIKPTVTVTMSGSSFVVLPKGFLEGEAFNAYRRATDAANGHYVAATKQKLVPAESAEKLMSVLHSAGFVVEVAPTVVAALQALLAQSKALLAQASDHLAKVEAQLDGRVLFPFQRAGVEWLVSRSNALLADEMGLGKTAQALCALPFGAPVVIVCPVVAKGVWKAEIKMWRKDFARVTVLSGRDSFRWPHAGEVVLTNYEILSKKELTVAPAGVVVIADEAHMVKNQKATRSVRFSALSTAAQLAGGRVWLLTATPLLNTPPELWQVLSSAGLGAEAFGDFGGFAKSFGYSRKAYGGTWGAASDSVRTSLGKVMLRRHRLDVLPDLPGKIRCDIEVNGLDSGTKSICDEVLALLDSQGIDLDAAMGETEATRMTSAAFAQISRARAALATAKIPSMLEVVEMYEDASEPLVVFSAHRAPIDLFAKREGWAVITGDVTPEKRAEIQKAFQAGELRGVAATIQAGGVAITLTRAHHALFVDLAWTPALNSQAEDRICRIGQDRGVIIKRLTATHALDARVMQLLTKKQIMIEQSVEAAAVKDAPVAIAAVSLATVVEHAEAAVDIMARAVTRAEATKPAPVPVYTSKFAAKFRRAAVGEVEVWAAQALQQLADLDPDGASKVNGAGFNKFDGPFGHEMAERVNDAGLTDAQWKAVVKMVKKYHAQVGRGPTENK